MGKAMKPLKEKNLDKARQKRSRHARDRLQFSPAAIQIESAPPPIFGRVILWTIMLLVVIAILWAYLGRVDIVAVATGKIIPSGKVRQIQPFERAVVQEIHVRDGQRVTRGDPLVSFDSTFSAADQQQAMDDLQDAGARWLVEYAYNQFLQSQSTDRETPAGLIETATRQLASDKTGIAVVTDHQFLTRLLANRIALHQAETAALQQEMEALAGTKRSARAIVEGLQATLPIIDERTESIRALLARQLASRDHYLQQEQQRIEARQRLASESARVASLEAQIGEVRAGLERLAQRALEQNLTALNDARLRRAMAQQRLRKADEQRQRSVLRAPVDGIVTQLQIHTIGGIVRPAEMLMNLTPINERLEVEAFIRNRDIGFVRPGQPGAIKIEAYNFTRYGSIDGTLRTLSSDAVEKEGLGLVYPAIVSMSANRIAVGDQLMALTAGMSVSVEIKTGRRRILDYFLSPLLKMASESIRER